MVNKCTGYYTPYSLREHIQHIYIVSFYKFKISVAKGELVDASVCTAFASQHFNTSGVIEVRLNSIRTADVLIDGTLLDFDESLVHQYPGTM